MKEGVRERKHWELPKTLKSASTPMTRSQLLILPKQFRQLEPSIQIDEAMRLTLIQSTTATCSILESEIGLKYGSVKERGLEGERRKRGNEEGREKERSVDFKGL